MSKNANKKEKPQRKPRNLVLRLCVFAFVLYAAIKLVDMQVMLGDRKIEAEQLTQHLEELRISNKDLERQINDTQDEEYVERVAREQLFVYPEERVFIDTSGS